MSEKRIAIAGWRTMGKKIVQRVYIRDGKNELLEDLLDRTLTCLVAKPDGTEAVATIEAPDPQADEDLGAADVTIEAAENDQEGDWDLCVFVDGEDLPQHHWRFKVVDTTPEVAP